MSTTTRAKRKSSYSRNTYAIRLRLEDFGPIGRVADHHGLSMPHLIRIATARFLAAPPTEAEIRNTYVEAPKPKPKRILSNPTPKEAEALESDQFLSTLTTDDPTPDEEAEPIPDDAFLSWEPLPPQETDPTPEEIAERTAQIRETWSERETESRLCGSRPTWEPSWTVPEVRCHAS